MEKQEIGIYGREKMFMRKKENELQIDWKHFYLSVLALVIPMALQNLINVGVTAADVVMLGARRRDSAVRIFSCRAGAVYYDVVFVRADIRSNGSDRTVLGEKGPADNREDFGSWNAGCGFCDCIILSGSADHARAAFADIYK